MLSSSPVRCLCGNLPPSGVDTISIFQTFLGIPCPDPNPCDFVDLVSEISTIESFSDILNFVQSGTVTGEDRFQDFDEVCAGREGEREREEGD